MLARHERVKVWSGQIPGDSSRGFRRRNKERTGRRAATTVHVESTFHQPRKTNIGGCLKSETIQDSWGHNSHSVEVELHIFLIHSILDRLLHTIYFECWYSRWNVKTSWTYFYRQLLNFRKIFPFWLTWSTICHQAGYRSTIWIFQLVRLVDFLGVELFSGTMHQPAYVPTAEHYGTPIPSERCVV